MYLKVSSITRPSVLDWSNYRGCCKWLKCAWATILAPSHTNLYITRLVSAHRLRIPPVLRVMKSMYAAIFILSWFLNKNSVSNRKHRFLLSLYYHLLGSLSNNDDDGNENTTKNTNLRPFKLYRVYLEPLNSPNVGNFSWSWILKGFIHVKQRKENLSSYVPQVHAHVLHKTSHWEVSRRSGAVDVKEMYWQAWCTCRAVVLLIKPIIVFWPWCCRRRSCLRFLLYLCYGGRVAQCLQFGGPEFKSSSDR